MVPLMMRGPQLLAENRRPAWNIEPPAGTPFEWLFDPDYWIHTLQDNGAIEPRHYLDVSAKDNSFSCLLVVTEIDELRQWMKVRLAVEYWNDQEADVATGELESESKDAEGFRVHWAGPHDKWRVMSPMGIKVSSGHATKQEAERVRAEIKAAKAA